MILKSLAIIFLKKVAKKVLTTQYFFGKIVFADAVKNRVEKQRTLIIEQ